MSGVENKIGELVVMGGEKIGVMLHGRRTLSVVIYATVRGPLFSLGPPELD